MAELLGKPIESAVDGENNPVGFDLAFPLRGRPEAAIESLRQEHGDDIYILPISASSCGGGIFTLESRPPGKVIGLRLDPPVEPRIRQTTDVDLLDIEIDEVVIDGAARRVYAGAAVTLDQLNRALRDTLGPSWRVPGADLTSYQYAAVGATFMTGGMGPQRRYFSDSVVAIALYDGTTTRRLEGEELAGYAGTYGWSGFVGAVACSFYEYPPSEVAFTLPVSDQPEELARLLARLAPQADIRLGGATAVNGQGDSELILGVEHVSIDSMQPLLKQGENSAASRRGADLCEKCRLAGADGLVFVNGLTHQSTDEFLFNLVDDVDADTPTIAGIALEYAELFHDPEEMRDLREAIPYAARMQTPQFRHLYKNHTDATVRIMSDQVETVMSRLWQHNRDYVNAVRTMVDSEPGLYGEILVYGHLNPQGVDPHNRVTLGSDEESVFRQAQSKLRELRAAYYRALAGLCREGEAELIGGEKTADSERAIYAALGGPEQAPAALYRRFQQQRQAVADASPMFNWRARSPYR